MKFISGRNVRSAILYLELMEQHADELGIFVDEERLNLAYEWTGLQGG